MSSAPISVPIALPWLAQITPYKGGASSGYDPQQPPLRLASNENPYGPSPQAIAACQEAAMEMHRYPDGHSRVLRQALAKKYHLPFEQILCGHGSDELLTLLVRGYAAPGDEVVTTLHSFLVYEIAARSVGATPVLVPEQNLRPDIERILHHITPRTKLVMLANPGNPTGAMLSSEELATLHRALPPHCLLVLDGAYAEYVDDPDYSAGEDLVRQHANVVMTRTFSKIYGLGGVRLGWAFAPPEICDTLHRIRDPFNLSNLAQAAGLAALTDVAHFDFCRHIALQERPLWREACQDIGLIVPPSQGNFLLADFSRLAGGREQGAVLATRTRKILAQQNILIRQMGGYRLAHCLRITIGTPENRPLVITALQKAIERVLSKDVI